MVYWSLSCCSHSVTLGLAQELVLVRASCFRFFHLQNLNTTSSTQVNSSQHSPQYSTNFKSRIFIISPSNTRTPCPSPSRSNNPSIAGAFLNPPRHGPRTASGRNAELGSATGSHSLSPRLCLPACSHASEARKLPSKCRSCSPVPNQ